MMPWTTLASKYLLKRWWMNVRQDHVRLPNGVELPEFHVLEYPDWVAAIPLTRDGEMVMVEQFRYGAGQVSLEFPAGALDAGEDPLAAAQRELLEETGYASDEWAFVGACYQDPSRQTNRTHFYVARNAYLTGAQTLDESEHIHVRLYPLEQALDLASRGEMIHGLHVAALFWAEHKGLVGV